ncbi:Alpha/beta hydrolase fold-5 [Lasallia pustulata]|uniref:Alpha/beta hydrolase fold-5 n=1 Tax=Lasallia pustulata TaxID=136370 RepID=A0A1W5D1A3_9LECA|nr:Alpha/beta hydrolase fold-5 [Lasallia pustulata]
MSSVLDWVATNAAEYGFDTTKIIARGISTGGYYAMRIAHTHANRLFAVVAQGGGCHYMFDAEWIGAQNQMEYPFALSDALACKMLVVDGTEDSIFPIEDNLIVAMRGKNKDLLMRANRGHMGNPGAEDILYQWIDDAVAGKP